MAKDLARIIAAKPPPGVSLSQAIITSWNPDTGENTLKWRDSTDEIRNVPPLPYVDRLTFAVGQVVMLIGNPSSSGGTSSWAILGRADRPPFTEPVTISGADVIIDGGKNIIVRGGGNITVEDGGDVIVEGSGEIRSSNFDGDTASNDPGTTGFALGSGLLALLGAFVPAVDFDEQYDLVPSGFSITTTEAAKVSVTVPVPSWAQEAGVQAVAGFAAINNTASADAARGRVRISGDDGTNVPSNQPAGGVEGGFIAAWHAAHSRTFDVSSLSSFAVEGRMSTLNGTWNDTANNSAYVTVLTMFKSTQ